MRSRLLPSALAAVLVTTVAPMAAAKMTDRLAQRNVGSDEGAAPPGDYSGGELGWGDDTSDDVGDVADGEGDLLRGQAPDGGDGAEPDEGGACFDTGEGEPVCIEPADPSDVASLDRYDLCAGATILPAVGCGVVAILCWSADAITVGAVTIPCLFALPAACGGAVGGGAAATALCG